MQTDTDDDGPARPETTPLAELYARLISIDCHLAIPIAVFDAALRYRTASSAWCSLHGLDREALIGRPHEEVMPRLSPDIQAAFHRARAGDDVQVGPLWVTLPDGENRWLRLQIAPIREETGEISGVVARAEDLSAQRDMERRLDVSERRLRLAMELGEIGLFERNYETGELFLSPEIGKFFHSESLPVTLEDWADILGQFDYEALHEAKRKALDPSGNGSFSLMVHPVVDGQTKTLEFQGKVKFVGEGEARLPQRAIGVVIDRTEGARLADALASAQRLEAVGRMAGMIAHDFNNLLTVILANLEFAGRQPMDDVARGHLDRAIDATRLGASFNQRLLGLAGSKQARPVKIALDEHLATTWTILERLLGEDLHLHLQPGAHDAHVLIDQGELDGMILNLVVNAKEAMKDRGEISIKTERIQLSVEEAARRGKVKPGDFVSISVRDGGRGMTPEVLERALEPFFTTKMNDRGTGLGLTSVANTVARAGGSIELASTPGDGTVVTLLLPEVPAPSGRRDRPSRSEMPMGDGQLVLVVEDDPLVREATLNRFEALGYAVIEAGDVEQALTLLEAGAQVDLVFSDIILPGAQSGYDLSVRVRRDYPGIPILLTSGHASKRLSASRGDLGDVPLLPKPHTLMDLADAVARALRSRDEDRP